MPRAMLEALTRFPTYGIICQVVSTLVGLLAFAVLHRSPRKILGFVKPAPLGAAVTELIAPLVFVVASYVALKSPSPTCSKSWRPKEQGHRAATPAHSGRQ